jgi:hypothetical protein
MSNHLTRIKVKVTQSTICDEQLSALSFASQIEGLLELKVLQFGGVQEAIHPLILQCLVINGSVNDSSQVRVHVLAALEL